MGEASDDDEIYKKLEKAAEGDGTLELNPKSRE